MISYLEELFKYYFGAETPPTRRPPSPRADHHVGTKEFRYTIKHTDKQRRHAIKAGIEELKQLFMMTVDEKKALDMAIKAKKKRLILIRTHHRNKPSCHTLHSDVIWLYSYYKLDRSGLKFECSTP
tara:strand:- start:253 stop:630 length:378 start_codon:yes stop_codon:yes gene_type:complete